MDWGDAIKRGAGFVSKKDAQLVGNIDRLTVDPVHPVHPVHSSCCNSTEPKRRHSLQVAYPISSAVSLRSSRQVRRW